MLKEYTTQGTCSKKIFIDYDETTGRVNNVRFLGGCDGNTQGVCRLVAGLPATQVIATLGGIDCRGRGTSCPDQLARVLKEIVDDKG
ncbi:MAG: TIGR03905 family TSCPD domain-containing protein [Muribaculaceae bacterium]